MHARESRYVGACVLLIITILADVRAGGSQHTGPPTASVTYRIENPAAARESLDVFSSQQLSIVEMLNRTDTRHLRRLNTLVVPQEWH